ncbi:MotA/TolQ/ExbB proton channel family protein [Gilvimarinus polysaccharolyticus]|uniref:MotA/TolQ/ExbB proton channel family protein n=1 Tax=Gilvimarinus polysaccharolyticus TaxID=863921 RepID=UPI00067394B7|nr:MotA/TolQ/ExbB proton channel family protein [Gilvimarinus polysaccharolyticus]
MSLAIIILRSLLPLLLCSTMVYADGLPNKVEASLLADIKSAQLQLAKTQKQLTVERMALGKKLHNLSDDVRNLRKDTAVARRLADEQTLSLDQLRERLAEWRNQGRYQHNLLASQHQQLAHGRERDLPVRKSFAAGLDWLQLRVQGMEQQLYPEWHTASLVSLDGEVVSAAQIKVGPVEWYIQTDTERGGLLQRSDEQPMPMAALAFNRGQLAQLQQLQRTGRGDVSFDPTLNRALALAQNKEPVLGHLTKGGVWVLPILAFALFALVIGLAKALQLWREPKLLPALAERCEKLVQNGEGDAALGKLSQQAQGAQREMIEITRVSGTSQQRDDRLFACLLTHKHRLEYWLGAIAITAAVSPLLGLLGTVSGMIKTFKMMTLFGAGDPAVVSGGISEALITTELGLVVAIPALLLHAVLQRWVKSYYSQLETDAIKFSQIETEQKSQGAQA